MFLFRRLGCWDDDVLAINIVLLNFFMSFRIVLSLASLNSAVVGSFSLRIFTERLCIASTSCGFILIRCTLIRFSVWSTHSHACFALKRFSELDRLLLLLSESAINVLLYISARKLLLQVSSSFRRRVFRSRCFGRCLF